MSLEKEPQLNTEENHPEKVLKEQEAKEEIKEPFFIQARIQITTDALKELFFSQRHNAFNRFLLSLSPRDKESGNVRNAPLLQNILDGIKDV